MTRRLLSLPLLAALACGEPDSMVIVSVDASQDVPPVSRIRAIMSNGGAFDVRLYPEMGGDRPIAFPATFGIVLPPSRSGVLDIALEGLAPTLAVVAHGDARVLIRSGGRVAVLAGLKPGASLCGDGRLDAEEECDDGGRVSGDGCDHPCRLEPGSAGLTRSDSGTGVADAGAPVGAPARLANGSMCTQAAQCTSGFCAEGICCNTACGRERCTACDLPGSAGTCRPAPAGTICAPATCTAGTYTQARLCDGAGTCRPAVTSSCGGYLCGSGGMCLSRCTSDADCAPSVSCRNGSCGSLKPLGAGCTAGGECVSGFCSQGVCCSTACAGVCRSCALPGSAGTCVLVPPGQDPLEQCADQGAASCGTDGACNGAGGCRRYSAGTPCAPVQCANGVETSARTCDGAGTCRPSTTRSCGFYACGPGGTCLTQCSSTADCAAPAECSAARCAGPLKATGAPCGAPGECASGFCQQGVCCATVCSGACRSCALAGSLGTCAEIPEGQSTCGGRALFVYGRTTIIGMDNQPYPSDWILRMRLEAKGLTVVQVLDSEARAEDAMGKALVFISGTVSSTAVADKFADAAVPIITNKHALYDDLAMTGPTDGMGYGTASNQTQIAITNAAHALAAGLTGMPTVFATQRSVRWGAPSSAAIRVATVVGSPTQIALFAYPRGAMMMGKTAPAKRIAFFGSESTSSMNIYSPDGVKLLDAAIDWALSSANN